jgi:hypothetical protein
VVEEHDIPFFVVSQCNNHHQDKEKEHKLVEDNVNSSTQITQDINDIEEKKGVESGIVEEHAIASANARNTIEDRPELIKRRKLELISFLTKVEKIGTSSEIICFDHPDPESD